LKQYDLTDLNCWNRSFGCYRIFKVMACFTNPKYKRKK